MFRIKIKYFGKVRIATGKKEETLEINREINNVRDLLNYLTETYGKKFREIVLKNGELAPDIIVLVNRKSIGTNLGYKLKSGDEVSLLPFVSGG